MAIQTLPPSARLKLDLMFNGVRYSDALARAAEHAFPNYYPYRFQPGEPDPTGQGHAKIPYLLKTEDGTLIRIKGNGDSPWQVSGSVENGYQLRKDGNGRLPITFEPLPAWMRGHTEDGFPMAQAGVSLHGDMAVINVAPGCQYFLADKRAGKSMRCTFCTYGAPDARLKTVGQDMNETSLPEESYARMKETLAAALDECEIRNIYLVGGSMTDWREEGERFIQLARQVQQVVQGRIPVSCGSGALPEQSLRQLQAEDLVDNICFNLEVWSEPLFASVCPGKERFVGYGRWIESLENAVDLWGRERVYSAMVAGIELEPEYKMSWREAAELALQGAEGLCSRGIIPIYSLYWPVGGRDHPDYMSNLMAYFETLNLGYRAIRQKYGFRIWDGFMSHRNAYMQLECDIDRAVEVQGSKR